MKRGAGDEDNMPPHGKRVVGPGEVESIQNISPGGGALGAGYRLQLLTTRDALAYLESAKEGLKNDKNKFKEFLGVMKDFFMTHKVDLANLIMRVKEMLKDHNNLILEFYLFLLHMYQTKLPPELEDKKPLLKGLNQAGSYVQKVKARFLTDEHVYKSFLDILIMYKRGTKTIDEVYEELALLFKDHNDLLEDFKYYFP